MMLANTEFQPMLTGGAGAMVNPALRRRLMPGADATPAPSLGFRPTMPAPGGTATTPAGTGWLSRLRGLTPTAAGGGPSPTPAAPGLELGDATPMAPTPASTPLPQDTTLPYGTLGTIDPSKDLRSQVIAPGAESNRADLAKRYLDTWSQNELPQFRSALRGTIGSNAALGRLGSGMLRTDVGNLDLAEQQKYNTAAGNFMTDALGAQISDNANQRAELRGERSYQTSAEQAAADRERQRVLDEDYLTGSRFGRSATALQLGMAGNPSGVVGQAAGDAGARAAAGASAVGSALGSSNYLDLLRKILAQQGGGTRPTPTGTVVRDPTYPS